MYHQSTRRLNRIDLRPADQRPMVETFIQDSAFPVITKLNRNPDEFRFLGERLKAKESPKLRVLQVGIGDSVIGETLHILDILERSGKDYELFCMDRSVVVIRHALEDQFAVKGEEYALAEQYNSAILGEILGSLASVRDLRRGPDYRPYPWMKSDRLAGIVSADFTFDVPSAVLDRITYVVGDIANDRLPLDLKFDAIVCFRTLYQVGEGHPPAIVAAIENMVRSLAPEGLMALDSARMHVYRIFDEAMERRLHLKQVYDSKTDSLHPLNERPRIFEPYEG